MGSKCLMTAACLALLVVVAGLAGAADVDLSPGSWPEGELARYEALNMEYGDPSPDLEVGNGMVVGTSGALAVRAGVEALRQGGSAADAALTTSLAQVCLNAGSIVSYAGIMTMVYYDASTGEVESMNAGWNAPLEERDPLSIPPANTPSGRQVLVPGFMAGVEAAHRRFGRLEFSQLFEPAIFFAENGFEVGPFLNRLLVGYKGLIDSSPGLREMYTKEGGARYELGDRLTQPGVAVTLRGVAETGAAYMYSGLWARTCVTAVKEHGGKLTLDDFARYPVLWSKPYTTRYRDYDVYAVGPPSIGGANILSALNLLELANLKQYGHWTKSADALYRFIEISRAARMIPMDGAAAAFGAASREIIQRYMDIDDFSPASVIGKRTAQELWSVLQGPEWKNMKRDAEEAMFDMLLRRPGGEETATRPGHSDSVVAVDAAGNVAAIVHSINGGVWGTGIVVGGVALNKAGAIQQRLVQEVGPGGRVPDPTNPLIVLADSRPVLAAGCIGAGLHEAMMQNLENVLDFGMDPKTAVETPYFMSPVLSPSEWSKQTVGEGDFPPEVLDGVQALGQELEIVPRDQVSRVAGAWIGIAIDPKTCRMTGGVAPLLNGITDGY